jgi:hypothetical protein
MTGRSAFRQECNNEVDLRGIYCDKWTELLDARYLINAGFFIGLTLSPDNGDNIFPQYIS